MGITFIPLDGGHYELAPYEECTEIVYQQLKERMKSFDIHLLEQIEHNLYVDELSKNDSIAIEQDDKPDCPSGACPLK